MKLVYKIILIAGMATVNMFAEKTDSLKHYDASSVEIISNKYSDLKNIPGTVNLISTEALKARNPLSGNEMLQSIPGLNVVDEEGAGLRLNVGIRGLDPDRSRSLLVLEDGVPVALAPYGEPEMYYTPSIERMSGVEVMKGSGSIIYGPQTIGGVINYLTNDPPENSTASFDFTSGSGGYVNAKLGYGNTYGSTGLITELYHKRADEVGLTNYSIYDFMTKIKFNMDNNSSFFIKVGAYDETSNSTYVGLTNSMYENGDYYTEIAPNDELDINRFSASLAYQKVLSKNTVLNTTLYGYNTTRFWKRQNFSRNSDISDGTGVVFGDTSIDNGAIYMRNGTGNRNREFKVVGIQPSIISEGKIFGFLNKFNAGIRLHYERALEQRINGTKATAESGNLINDEVRTGAAISAFIHDRIYLNDNLVISPGIRYEHFEYEREIFRISSNDTLINSNNNINTAIPGIGINYSMGNYTLFGGVHRGFAPPRIKDALTNEGVALELDAELSWNYELGLRSQPFSFLSFETTVYLMDFENQIIPVSESSGGMGTGLINGGETIHRGIELSSTFDLSTLTGIKDYLTMSANYSYNDSYYSSDRFIEDGDATINIMDNQLPYAPKYTFSAIANYELDFGLGMNLSFNYVDERFTDELNSIAPTNDGLSGIIDSYYTLDATISYLIKSYDLRAFLSVKNITDERYIASRRPRGIRVGLPRFISFGINYDL